MMNNPAIQTVRNLCATSVKGVDASDDDLQQLVMTARSIRQSIDNLELQLNLKAVQTAPNPIIPQP
jgi:hypothetical protein